MYYSLRKSVCVCLCVCLCVCVSVCVPPRQTHTHTHAISYCYTHSSHKCHHITTWSHTRSYGGYSPQVINCTVSTVIGVKSNSVMISWMGTDRVITSDSRVTINPTTSSGNAYTSSLQFTYLIEANQKLEFPSK